MIIKINQRMHKWMSVLRYNLWLEISKMRAKRYARLYGERALVLMLNRGGRIRPAAVRWACIPGNMRKTCMTKSLYVAYPPANPLSR